MIPNSISASSLSVATLCLTRWEAEYMHRGSKMSSQAADEGLAVHAGLEGYVKAVYLDKTHAPALSLLINFYEIGYLTVFGDLDRKSQMYKDGTLMLKKWFQRGDLEIQERTVISAEQKNSFAVNIGGEKVPYNYIIDRLDLMPEGDYRVVDYKTNRWGVNPSDLREKIQPRAYALAIQIAHPDAKAVWVEFDMLRHDGPVGTRFTKEDNAETRDKFRKQFQRIAAAQSGMTVPTLNPECNFCVLKSSCPALQRNIAVGGSFAMTTPERVDTRAQLEWQLKGVRAAIEELDQLILAEAKAKDVNTLESSAVKAIIGVSSRRDVDAERAALVLGSQLWSKYGSTRITMATIDELLKGTELTEAQKSQLRSIIFKKQGEPSVQIKVKP
jgi:RecB family exonuclease